MGSSRDAPKPYPGSWPARKTIHPHGLLRSEPNIAIRPTTCLFAITSYSARFAVGCGSRSSLKLFRRSQVQGEGLLGGLDHVRRLAGRLRLDQLDRLAQRVVNACL